MVWWACFAPEARAGAASVCAARKLLLCAAQRAVLGLASFWALVGACLFLGRNACAASGVQNAVGNAVRGEWRARACGGTLSARVARLQLVRSRQCTSFVRHRGQRGLCGISGRPVLVILGGRGVPFVRARGFVALCGRAGNVRGDRSLVGRCTVGAMVMVRFALRCALGFPCVPLNFFCAPLLLVLA